MKVVSKKLFWYLASWGLGLAPLVFAKAIYFSLPIHLGKMWHCTLAASAFMGGLCIIIWLNRFVLKLNASDVVSAIWYASLYVGYAQEMVTNPSFLISMLLLTAFSVLEFFSGVPLPTRRWEDVCKELREFYSWLVGRMRKD